MIEQEPICGVRTHFYHDASSYDMFRDHRVVESAFNVRRECTSWTHNGEVQHARKWQCYYGQPYQCTWLFNFLPTLHGRSVETSKHMASNMRSCLCFVLTGKMSHVLCGGETNQKEVNTKHMAVSWEIPAQSPNPSLCCQSVDVGHLRPYRLQNHAEPPQCERHGLMLFAG